MLPGMDVALFIPCYIDQLYPKVGLATASILARHGARVHFPEAQTCCGQPLSNSGGIEDARPLAEKFLSIFSPYQYVVCPSGSCTSMVRNHYDPYLSGKPGFDALKAKTFELCEFLHDVLQVKPAGRFPHKVGLHQSCHGLRELRLGSGSERRITPFNKVRALLEGLAGIELVDLARPDECCGFGGTFAVDEEAVSCAMGKDRIRDHERAGAEIMTGADVSCLMHMDGLIRRARKPMRVLHVAELLEEAAA
ncbi:MAG: (Fe-S)-binding protein [Myxococcales bacterium]